MYSKYSTLCAITSSTLIVSVCVETFVVSRTKKKTTKNNRENSEAVKYNYLIKIPCTELYNFHGCFTEFLVIIDKFHCIYIEF